MIQTTSILNVTNDNIVPKKRGRKPKKDLEPNIGNNIGNIIISVAEKIDQDKVEKENINTLDNNVFFNCNTITDNTICDSEIPLLKDTDIIEDVNDMDETDNLCLSSTQKPFAKKRGRKPKGGKIIQHIMPLNDNKEPKPNVILHLKCFFKDLQTNTLMNHNIESFNSNNNLSYELINNNVNINKNYDYTILKNKNSVLTDTENNEEYNDYKNNKQIKDNDLKELWKKLKELEHNLHINNISDKKSACFWCTCDFDNPPVYIPKHYIKETYSVYGCFCSPECATAYLMEENIDSSSKFERYYLINHIYGKIYNFKKNIKPAPNPYYLLDKYYGNLSIQEYRSLFKNERLFLVVDKPLTRILPELHEDNDDFIINNKIIPSNTSSSAYQIKKKMQKSQLKTNMLTEKFGFN